MDPRMLISDEDRNVKVGGTYMGATVTNLEETVEETEDGNSTHTKKLITVDTGIIYTLNLFEEKPKPKKKKPHPAKGNPSRNSSKNSIMSGSGHPSRHSSRDSIMSNGSSRRGRRTAGSGGERTPETPSKISVARAARDYDASEEDDDFKIPKEFENGKSFPITVFPKSDMPSKNYRATLGGGIGEWRYPKGHELSRDDHFLPQEIDLYYGDDEPLYPASEESSMSSFGLWGLDAGDDAPHHSWTRHAKNVCFPPGIEPGSDVDILGRWVYSPEKDTQQNAWPPPMTKKAWVFTEFKAPDCYDEDFDPRASQGVWRSTSNNSLYEQNNWPPQEVYLYHQEDDMLDDNLPNGTWGLQPGAKPEPATKMFPPKEVWFYPPGEEPEPECHVKGRWSMPPGKLNSDWPPKPVGLSGGSTSGSSMGSVIIPECFENGKLPIKVFPKSKMPKTSLKTTDDKSAPKKKKKVRFDLIGQWAYPEGEEENDDHWMPTTVDLYLGDSEPEMPDYCNSEESSLASFGVWGTKKKSSSSNDSMSLSLSFDWTPEDSFVFPPGIEPDDDEIQIHGKWAFPGDSGHEGGKIQWPPPMAEAAWVFPSKNVPAADNNEARGVWKFSGRKSTPGQEDERSQWQAKKVQLYSDYDGDDHIDSTKVWGKYGVRRGAEPDDKWNWEPKDLWFYPPNEEPDTDCMVQGTWAAEKTTWPPPTRKVGSRLRQVGKLEIPAFEESLASPKSPLTPSSARKSVGKLKMPATFGEVASPSQRRSVAKLKIPEKFLS